jgi:AbrB family looped-hinge helix DNA binding protein
MIIVMSCKNQITIPKKFVEALHLSAGALFDIRLEGNKIVLIPVETVEKKFTKKEYVQMEKLPKKIQEVFKGEASPEEIDSFKKEGRA